MSSSPSQNLLSPSPASNLLLSPEPQDSASNHSGQTGDSQHDYDSHLLTSNSNHDHSNGAPKRKPFKTEYKSKFTPFDQYVYNEVTDSFVKQSAPPQQASSVNASKSTQDLSQANNELLHAPAGSLSISGHEAHVYEPLAGAEGQANNEPWYKEVVRRNEKANEYRFKSEVGHNSPLITTRADSPYSIMTDRQFASPGGTESAFGDKMSTTSASDARSQLSDTTDMSQQQQHRFTPNDYKRDHLIAHMANNNNFNLPREQQEPTSLRAAPRRPQPASGARPTSRIGAQVRSRSQSTRRQPAAPSSVSANNNSPSVAATKSNQSTPTRTVASRAGLTSANKSQPSSGTGAARVPARAAPTSRVTSTSSSRMAATAKTRTGATTTPTTATKRAPATPTTATLRITSKPSNGTSPMSGRPAPGSAKRTPTVTPTTRTATGAAVASRSAPRPTTGASSTTPVGAARTARTGASMTRASPATSAKTKTTPKTVAQPTSSATTAVKSIKTPKAIAAAKEAGLAAGALAAAAATGVVLAASPPSEEESAQPNTTITPGDSQENQEPTQKQAESEVVLPVEHMHYQSEEPNLITTTTEAGNMLADELAQAEKEACEARQLEHLQSQESPTVPQPSFDAIRKESSAEPEDEPSTQEQVAVIKSVVETPTQEQVEITESLDSNPVKEQPEIKESLDCTPVTEQPDIKESLDCTPVIEQPDIKESVNENLAQQQVPTFERIEEQEALPHQEHLVDQDSDVPPLDTFAQEESTDKRTFVVDHSDKQTVFEEDEDELQEVDQTPAEQSVSVTVPATSAGTGSTLGTSALSDEESDASEERLAPYEERLAPYDKELALLEKESIQPKTTITPSDSQEDLELSQEQSENGAVLPVGHEHYQSEGPDLIDTTPESGDILAKELAQEDQVAYETRQFGNLQSQEPLIVPRESSFDIVSDEPRAEPAEETQLREEVATAGLIQEQEALPQPDQLVDQEINVPHLDTLKGEESAAKHFFIENCDDKQNLIEEDEGDSPGVDPTPVLESVKQSVEDLHEENQENYDSKELVNGLADGLVSAEDRFDSSERDVSSELDDDGKQTGFGAHSDHQVDQNYNDEPYSIMPTTASQAIANAFEVELSPTGEKNLIDNRDDDDIITKLDSAVRDIQLEREANDLLSSNNNDLFKDDYIRADESSNIIDDIQAQASHLAQAAKDVSEDVSERRDSTQETHDNKLDAPSRPIIDPIGEQLDNKFDSLLTPVKETVVEQLDNKSEALFTPVMDQVVEQPVEPIFQAIFEANAKLETSPAEKLVEEKKEATSERPQKTLSFNLSEDIITTASDSSDGDKLEYDKLVDGSPALIATNEQDFIQTQKVFDDFLTDLNISSKSLLGDAKQEVETRRFEDDDLINTNDESNDLIDSSPALKSADTTLQDD